MKHSDLLVVGGAEQPARAEIMKTFVALAGGSGKRFAILPAATVDPLGGYQKMRQWLGEVGVGASQVDLLEVSNSLPGGSRGAWDTAVLEKARAADAIWILGGDQNLIVDLLTRKGGGDSPLLGILRGKVLGGTSAGAAVMSDPMIGGGTSFGALALPRASAPAAAEMARSLLVTPGLGFFPEGIVDQHFDTRARLGRLLEASLVEDGGRRLAFGIAEATGLVYRAREARIEVVGRGGVYIVDPRAATRSLEKTASGPRVRIEGALLHLLRAGDSLDLSTGALAFGERRRLEPGEAVFDSPEPVASGVLSAYGDLASFCSRLLLDNRPEGLFSSPGGPGPSLPAGRHVRSYLIEEIGGRPLAWELRLGRIEGQSALWFGEEYSFESVRVDILPIGIDISSSS